MPSLLRLSDGFVDLDRRAVVRADRDEASLTPTEHALLSWLADRPGLAVPLQELKREVWRHAPGVKSRAPYVAIQRLRAKIEVDPGEPRHLVSVHGTGYRLDLEGEADQPPPTASAPTAFFGREDEATALAGAWLAGARLVTLRGPGGAGKTRLALEHVHRSTPGLDGVDVLVVRLGEAADMVGLVDRVAAALGLALPGREDEARTLTRVGRVLRHRGPLLLVLDNAEGAVDAARRAVSSWLADAPGLRLLVTSRRALDHPDEHLVDVGALDPESAMQLLVDRAARVRWGFRPAASDEALLRTLVTEDLDGLPLAIELAAARLGSLDARGLVDRLRERFRLLRGSRTEGRFDSLRAALMWSWELLGPGERSVLAQASVFAGGFDVDAAEQVLDAGEAWVPDVLASLVDHSLLHVGSDDGLRYEMLRSVRALATEQLPDGAPARGRHRQWATDLVEGFSAVWKGGKDLPPALLRERENLRAAHASALVDRDVAAAAPLAEALDTIAHRRGPFQERLPRLEATLALLPESAPARIGLLWRQGDALRHGHQLAESRRVLEAAVELGRGHGRVAEPLTALLAVEARQNRREAYWARLDEALEAAELEGDRRRAGLVLHNLSNLERQAGSLDQAAELGERALAIARDIGNAELEVLTLVNLASTASSAGRRSDAMARYGQAMRLARSHALETLRATLLVNLAHLQRRAGDADAAGRSYDEAMELAQQTGKVETEWYVRHGRVALALDSGDVPRALAELDALEREQVEGIDVVTVIATALRGITLAMGGDLHGAELELRGGLQVCLEQNAGRMGDMIGCYLATVLARLGQVDEAQQRVDALDGAFAARDDPTGKHALAVVRAQLCLVRGDREGAEALLATVERGDEDVEWLIRLLDHSGS